MSLKYYLIILFVLLNIFVYYVTEKNIQSKIKYAKYHHMHNLQLNYENFMISQSEKADVIYSTTINTLGFKDIVSRAWLTKDEKQRDLLRKRLYELLKDRYSMFKEQGLLQYQIVFPNNISFLRVHKKDKYGDDLSGVRKDFEKVNKTKEVVRGFSPGKTAHAFRNIYPIYDKYKKYIGSIEISYPSELLQKNLNDISEIHTHFLVNKHIFDSKMWSRNDRVLQYAQSIENENFMHTTGCVNFKKHMSNHKNRIISLQKEIDKKIMKNEIFSLISKNFGEDYKVVSFYPIGQSISHELAAWIVAYDDAPFLDEAINDNIYVRVSLFFIFGLLLYFIYKINKQKNELTKILNSYNDNVIFSTTDLKGIITHVSKAFCEISGYEEDELIGKPHNIVRHYDMSKENFYEMWTTIKSGDTWRGELKNFKKDGGFYWVDAEIESLYDGSNNHIGYSAIRHDITHKKENEAIQKEIIFTMGSIGESRSEETGNHVKRVAEYSGLLAKKYGLINEEIELIKQASPMHDIGKVGIPDSILKKPAKLNDKEFTIMRTHAELGHKMLSGSKRSLLKSAAIVAYEHHERWDGRGYPRGLKGEEIHIYGRITAIADVFDALGSQRVYKEAWDDEKIFELFKEESGKHFDPTLVDIFFENIDEFIKIREMYT